MSKENESTTGFIVLVVIGLIIWGIVSLFNRGPKAMEGWSLIYLDSANLSHVAGTYPTREECAQKLAIARGNQLYDRPECGSDCKMSEEFTDIYVCDETFEL